MDDEVALQCVLRVNVDGENDGDPLTKFTKETWETVRGIAQARERYQTRSKYCAICESINFEAEPMSHYGFHSSCYRKFTAYQIQSKDRKKCSNEDTVETRSKVKVPVVTTSTIGVLEKKCIFCKGPVCKHFPRGFETLSPYETMQAQENILNCAKQLKDNDFLRKYGHIDFIAKEVMYHKTCRVRYISKGAKVQEKEDSSSSTVKREAAFSQLLSHIDSEIFLKNKSEKLVDVNQAYIKFLIKEGIEEPTPDSYHLYLRNIMVTSFMLAKKVRNKVFTSL